MKTLIQSVIVIAVTTILVSAFSVSTLHQSPLSQNTNSAVDTQISRVVVIGKRMTAQQKSEYDAQLSIAAK